VTWIKICGTTSCEDAAMAIDLGATAIGLIFAPSRREVSIVRAREIASLARGRVEIIGVFKEALRVRAVHEAVGLDRVQIHGTEVPDVSLPRLRAVRPEDLARREGLLEGELLLIDGSEGRGRTFDWTLARHVPHPFVLAGGLTPQNVSEALEQTRPFGVDVTSGVESVPGRKDYEKMARFIEAARRFNAGR
jgi:phosphoribosylanthranilate isomerase